jgi:hypothetical protein
MRRVVLNRGFTELAWVATMLGGEVLRAARRSDTVPLGRLVRRVPSQPTRARLPLEAASARPSAQQELQPTEDPQSTRRNEATAVPARDGDLRQRLGLQADADGHLGIIGDGHVEQYRRPVYSRAT